MDLAHLHLILNHLPVFGIMFGFLVLAWGVLRRFEDVQNTGLVILVIAALAAIPVYLTGEPAEKIVEHLPGVTEQIIEVHEDAALFALTLSIVTGVLAIFALAAKHFFPVGISQLAIYAVLLLSVVTGASMAYTANLGGQVRHTEIRQAQSGTPGAEARPTKTKKDDDDH